MNDSERFTLRLFPEFPSDHRAELRAFHKERAKPNIQRFYVDAGRLAADAEQLSVTMDVYVGVAYRGMDDNGTKKNLQSVSALWCDLDVGGGKGYESLGAAWASLHRFTLEPSFAVESGGGLHAYWQLKEPWPLRTADDIAAFERQLKRLATALGGDMAATDASRILRIPGTINHKFKPGRLVTFEELDRARVPA